LKTGIHFPKQTGRKEI